MRKTCTNCGSQEFRVELGERLTQPRRPKQSGHETYVRSHICAECGEKQ